MVPFASDGATGTLLSCRTHEDRNSHISCTKPRPQDTGYLYEDPETPDLTVRAEKVYSGKGERERGREKEREGE